MVIDCSWDCCGGGDYCDLVEEMSDKFNCLLVGESGTGKSPLCGTLEHCEQTSPCLLLDVDMGSMSIIEKPLPSIIEIDSWHKVQSIYALLKKQDWKKLAELTGREAEYKSVVIDSGTELEYMLRSSIVGETGGEVPEQQHYLKTQERFRRLYRAFRDLPMSFVMTAGVRELKDDVAGIVRHFPAFQPALAKDLIRMTDLILFQDVKVEEKEWVRTLQTTLSQRIIARDRSQKLESIIKGKKLYFADIARKVLS